MTSGAARAGLVSAATCVCLGLAATDRCVGAAVRTPDDLAAHYAGARGAVAAADATYRRALIASLDAENPYERKRALGEVGAYPMLIDDVQVIAALVRRLDEAAPLQDSGCVDMIERLDRAYGGQGEELEYARCRMKGGTSNGAVAAKLLGDRPVFGLVAAWVAERPASVEAVLTALAPSQVGPLSDLKPVLERATSPASQAALLRLAIAIDVDRDTSPNPALMASVVSLQESPTKRVSELAGLAVLRLTPGPVRPALEGPRQRAVAVVAARLRDAGDAEVVNDVKWLGSGVMPFMPEVLARFDRATMDREQRRALVAVFRRAGPAAHEATPRLMAVLHDEKQLYLQGDALAALAAIGPAAAAAKPALMPLLGGDRAYFQIEAVETLAAIGARLTRPEFDPLFAAYREDCRRAGSIYMFDLRRDENCNRRASALERLAKLGGHRFREAEWRSDGQEE
jgi:hypothetical protein